MQKELRALRREASVARSRAEEMVVTAKFTKALTQFANCHCGYNSSSYTSDEDVKQLGRNITLMTNYSESITFIISQNNTTQQIHDVLLLRDRFEDLTLSWCL